MSNAKPPVFNVGTQPHVFKSARTLSPTAELSPAAKEMLEKAHRAPQVAHRSSRMRRELVTFLVALAERDPAAPVALAERPGDALNLAQDLMRFGLVAGLHSRGVCRPNLQGLGKYCSLKVASAARAIENERVFRGTTIAH